MAKKQSSASLGITKVAEQEGIKEYRLKNGLKILLKEDHSAPVVSFMVVYRVGSRNEAVGHTGATHFLEHMMFKGTKKFNPADNTGVMEIFGKVGGLLNATTWLDRTNYFECVGSEYLELCIQVEADRMRNLNLREEDRESEMRVVLNEFSRSENNPASVLGRELMAVAFREHPYHHPTIGWWSDVANVPMEKLKEFYDQYYWPNNATVIAVGDFTPDNALKLIHKHFGKIKSSPKPIPTMYTQEPPQEGERRFEIRRAGDLPRMEIGYHTPEATHPDIYALDALHSILGDSSKRSSRLYKRLIETGLVTDTSASVIPFRDPSLFSVDAVLAPGKTFAEVEQVIYEELERLANEPVDEEELNRIKAANRKGTILGSADPQVFANMLCSAESCADWTWLINYDKHFDALTPADIQRVARTYFRKTNRTVGHFIPLTAEEMEAGATKLTAFKLPPSRCKTKKNSRKNNRSKAGKGISIPAPTGGTSSFGDKVVKKVLSNGLTVLVYPNPGVGSVSVQGFVVAGTRSTDDSKDRVPAVALSRMLNRGSGKYSKEQAAEILEEMGAHLNFGAERYRVNFKSHIVKEDLGKLLELAADMLQNPLLLEEELSLVKQELRAQYTRALNDTGDQADNHLSRAIYPEGHRLRDQTFAESLQQIDAMDIRTLQDLHARAYHGGSTVLCLVGDVEPEAAINLVKQNFGKWKSGTRPHIVVPDVERGSKEQRIDVFLPDKANVDIVIGHPVPVRRDQEDYFAASIANAALGKDSLTSRLGKVVRVKHGLTYGIYSSLVDTSFANGLWEINVSVNPENIDRTVALVKEIVEEYLIKGITEAELKHEVGRAIGQFQVSLRSPAGIAAALLSFEFLGLGPQAMDDLAAGFLKVTKKDVDVAMRKYFHPESFVVVAAGTTAAQPKAALPV